MPSSKGKPTDPKLYEEVKEGNLTRYYRLLSRVSLTDARRY